MQAFKIWYFYIKCFNYDIENYRFVMCYTFTFYKCIFYDVYSIFRVYPVVNAFL